MKEGTSFSSTSSTNKKPNPTGLKVGVKAGPKGKVKASKKLSTIKLKPLTTTPVVTARSVYVPQKATTSKKPAAPKKTTTSRKPAVAKKTPRSASSRVAAKSRTTAAIARIDKLRGSDRKAFLVRAQNKNTVGLFRPIRKTKKATCYGQNAFACKLGVPKVSSADTGAVAFVTTVDLRDVKLKTDLVKASSVSSRHELLFRLLFIYYSYPLQTAHKRAMKTLHDQLWTGERREDKKGADALLAFRDPNIAKRVARIRITYRDGIKLLMRWQNTPKAFVIDPNHVGQKFASAGIYKDGKPNQQPGPAKRIAKTKSRASLRKKL